MHTVLIAEDEMLVRIGILHMINWEQQGYEVIGAVGDGSEAISFIRDHHPDLVLLDLNMPVLDGIGVLKKMREEGLESLPVILTFHEEFDVVREAFRLGAAEYLLKNELSADMLTAMLKKIEDRLPCRETARIDLPAENHMLRKMVSAILDGDELDAEGKMPAMKLALFRVQNMQAVKARYESGSIEQALAALAELWQQEMDPQSAFLISRPEEILMATLQDGNHPADLTACAARLTELARIYLDVTLYSTESETVHTVGELLSAYDDMALQFPVRETTDSLTQKAMCYIAQHYTESVTVAELAQHFYVSESLMSRRFNKHAGMSVPSYLNHIRIERAEALLKNTDMKVYEVAEQVGFNSVAYFCTIFKRMKGYSPSSRKDE